MEPSTDSKRFVICPVCNRSNPEGTKFCQHCWGAVINQDHPLTEEETAVVQKQHENFLKRKRRIRFGILGGAAAAVIVLIFLFIFNYTDTFSVPPEEVNSDSPPGEWTMFRHDPLRSGSAGQTDILPEGTLKWSFTTGAAIHSSPVVVDGKVYFGSRDNRFYSLDAETGEKIWDMETGSWVESSPAVSGGTVYFGSNDGYLYALDARSGVKTWEFKTRYPVRSSPAIAGDTIYFGSDDYYLYALKTEDGKVIWKYDTRSPAGVSPVIDKGILYYGSGGGYSYTLNAEDGQRRLRYRTRYSVFSSPVVSGETVYFTTTNGLIVAVEGIARTWLWEHEIRPFWAQAWAMMSFLPKPSEQSGFLWTLSLRRPNPTTPVIDGNTMYLGSNEYIIAIELSSQKILWEFRTGGTVRSAPAKAGPVIYAGSDDGSLYAVDAATGELRWKFETGSDITSSPAIVDGVVYFGSHDGTMYALK